MNMQIFHDRILISAALNRPETSMKQEMAHVQVCLQTDHKPAQLSRWASSQTIDV